MIINSESYRVLKGFHPKVSPSIKWGKRSNGKPIPNDYGQDSDFHETTITLFQSYEKMTDLVSFLRSEDGAGYIFLTVGVGEFIFGPHIADDQLLTVIVMKYGELEKAHDNVYELDLTLRLLDHTSALIPDDVTENDFAQEKLFATKHITNIQGDRTWELIKQDSYANTFIVNEATHSEGLCKFTARIFEYNGSNNAGQLVKALLTRVRAHNFLFPGNLGAWGIDHPFGPDSSGPYVTKILSWSLGAKDNTNFWDIEFQLAEI